MTYALRRDLVIELLQEHARRGFCEYEGQRIEFNKNNYHTEIHKKIFKVTTNIKEYFEDLLFGNKKAIEEIWEEYHVVANNLHEEG